MSVCIQYSRPASGDNEYEIYGFDVAVNNFLSAWFRHSGEKQFLCRPTDIPSFDHFKSLAQSAGHDAEAACVGLDPRHPQSNLESVSCLFRPDPLTVDLIWRRQQVAGRGYATCGLVHTMSGERIARAVGDLCLAPSDGTDALICPSVSIQKAVHNLWDIYGEYLNHRFGGVFTCPVQTPVIPLGIDTAKFARATTPEKRATQRAALGAADDEVVILFVGRLSFATKAHPLPLFLAAERATQRLQRKVRLVMFGYFKPKDMEPHFRALATDLCKTLAVEFIMNDDPRFPEGLWAGADIFSSLSDNVQESFGLTPIEAMACGLPVVVTDWDGYREGVRNGEEGFLIPTMTPPASAGMAIAQSYYNIGNYGVALSGAAQSTCVDIETCTHALTYLIDNADLRRTMGTKGRQRAQGTFDWKHVIGAYENVWKSLSELRSATPPAQTVPKHWPAMNPAFPNPWRMFDSFPTTQLLPTDILRIAAGCEEVDAVLRHSMNYFVPDLLLPPKQMRDLIELIRRAHAVRIQDILVAFPADRHDVFWRCFGWLLKHGICTMERQ